MTKRKRMMKKEAMEKESGLLARIGGDEFAVLTKGVSVAPGTMFSADKRFSHCIRINTSFEWGPHTARAISILAALVAEEIKG